jgi:hypothetical protein
MKSTAEKSPAGEQMMTGIHSNPVSGFPANSRHAFFLVV